tara:strand:- start:1941 stop:2261 length:321 start_codon:yes stop_codon:yes gene_type:complete
MIHDLPVISLEIGSKKYNLYVAKSYKQKKQGLSGVSHLAHNEGMLFPYDDEKPRTFQFRDTLLPLEVYFIGADGKVLQKSISKPRQKSSIHCDKPCKWVIEILAKG